MARGAEEVIQAQVDMGNDVAVEDDFHIVAGVGKCLFARTEEVEHRVEEEEENYREEDTHDDVQDQNIAQNMIGAHVVLLPQLDGNQRGGSDAHERTEGGS